MSTQTHNQKRAYRFQTTRLGHLLSLLRCHQYLTFFFVIHTAWILLFFPGLWEAGAIVFSDLDFGFRTSAYIERITGLWNDTWGTFTLFNSSRLPVVAPLYILTALLGQPVGLLQKLLMFSLLLLSAVSLSWFSRHILLQYIQKKNQTSEALSLLVCIFAGILYASNPWVLIRLQHIYLVVGYAFTPATVGCAFLTTFALQKRIETLRKRGLFAALKQLLHASVLMPLGLTSICWMLASGAVHYFVFLGIMLGSWFALCIWWALLRRKLRLALCTCLAGIAVVVLCLCVSAFWLVPQMAVQLGGGVLPANVNTLDSLGLMSRYISLKNVLLSMSYWWGYFSLERLPATFWMGGALLTGLMWIGIARARHFLIGMWISLGYIVCTVLAMGPKGITKSMYMYLLYHAPLSGKLGFLLRDPNKLIGLQLFFGSILFAIGAYCLCRAVLHVLERTYTTASLRTFRLQCVRHASIGIIFVSLFAYVYPVGNLYLGHFLRPVETPESYHQITRHMEEQYGSSTVWLSVPRYEDILSPSAEFAIAEWNAGRPFRPTSSVDIWSLPHRTYHPLEGAYNTVKQLYRFLEKGLSDHASLRVPEIAKALGVQLLLHHTDLAVHERDESKSGWELQQFLQKPVQFGFFEAAAIPQTSSIGRTFSRLLLSRKNIRALDTYTRDERIDLTATVPLLYQQMPEHSIASLVQEGDLIDEDSAQNITLSSLPKPYHISPKDLSLRGDPFTTWAISTTAHTDWTWHTSHLNLDNAALELDAGNGVLFTYVPASIPSLPFESQPRHPRILSMTDIVHDSAFYKEHAPERISVLLEPTSRYDHLPSFKASIAPGDSKLWQVISSKRILANQRTGYAFDMTVSSVDARKLHIKFVFRDKVGREIGVGYAGAPSHPETFDALRFHGSFITPPKTHTMEFQLWSMESPTAQTRWWIHDFNLFDLSGVTEANVLTHTLPIEEAGEYTAFIRALSSPVAGEISVSLSQGKNESAKTIDIVSQHSQLPCTIHSPSCSEEMQAGIEGFTWYGIDAVALSEGTAVLEIENHSGFNAITDIIVVPKHVLAEHSATMQRTLNLLPQHITMEAEQDFALLSWYAQAERAEPFLSLGHGRYLHDGTLERTIEVFSDGKYVFNVYLDPRTKVAKHKIGLMLIDPETNKKVVNIPNILLHYTETNGQIFLPPVDLPAGPYVLKFVLFDRAPTEVSTANFRALDFSTVDKDIVPVDESWHCNKDEKLHAEDLAVHASASRLTSKVFPGYACDWAISTSQSVATSEGEEWYLEYRSHEDMLRLSHTKIVFFSDEDQTIGHAYLDDIYAQEVTRWQTKRHFFTAPKDATKLRLQFWARKHPRSVGQLNVRDIVLKRFRTLPNIDLVTLSKLEPTQKALGSLGLAGSAKGAKRNVETLSSDQPTHVRGVLLYETFQPFWNMRHEGQKLDAVPLLGMLNGYLLSDQKIINESVEFEYSLSPYDEIARWSFVVSACVLFGLTGGYLRLLRRKK